MKPILFEAANFDQISIKMKATNDELTIAQNPAALNIEEAAHVESVLKKLSQTRFYHVSTFSDKEWDAIEKALTNWPLEKLPVVFDILRIMALHPVGVRRLLESNLLRSILSRATEEGGHPASIVLAFRLVTNCFCLESVKSDLVPFHEEIADLARSVFPKSNQNAKLAIATSLLNFAILSLTGNLVESAKKISTTASALLDSVGSTDSDGELSYILLAALGTAVYWSNDVKLALHGQVTTSTLATLAGGSNPKTREAAADVAQLLK